MSTRQFVRNIIGSSASILIIVIVDLPNFLFKVFLMIECQRRIIFIEFIGVIYD